MKKLLYKVPLLLCCLIMLCSMSGCALLPESILPEYDGEYFRYAVRTEKGKKKGYLIGLTELGTEQTELILPQEIDDVPIIGIGYKRKSALTSSGWLGSDNLKKLYIPFSLQDWEMQDYKAHFKNAYIIRLYDMEYNFDDAGNIISYPVYKQIINQDISYSPSNQRKTLLANVSYMYNYEFAENEGYYWVDSYDNETISFIPPEPERENYTFAGWYKEPECINAWDFETDTTGEEIELRSDNFDGYDANDITFLYAKWIKN